MVEQYFVRKRWALNVEKLWSLDSALPLMIGGWEDEVRLTSQVRPEAYQAASLSARDPPSAVPLILLSEHRSDTLSALVACCDHETSMTDIREVRAHALMDREDEEGLQEDRDETTRVHFGTDEPSRNDTIANGGDVNANAVQLRQRPGDPTVLTSLSTTTLRSEAGEPDGPIARKKRDGRERSVSERHAHSSLRIVDGDANGGDANGYGVDAAYGAANTGTWAQESLAAGTLLPPRLLVIFALVQGCFCQQGGAEHRLNELRSESLLFNRPTCILLVRAILVASTFVTTVCGAGLLHHIGPSHLLGLEYPAAFTDPDYIFKTLAHGCIALPSRFASRFSVYDDICLAQTQEQPEEELQRIQARAISGLWVQSVALLSLVMIILIVVSFYRTTDAFLVDAFATRCLVSALTIAAFGLLIACYLFMCDIAPRMTMLRIDSDPLHYAIRFCLPLLAVLGSSLSFSLFILDAAFPSMPTSVTIVIVGLEALVFLRWGLELAEVLAGPLFKAGQAKYAAVGILATLCVLGTSAMHVSGPPSSCNPCKVLSDCICYYAVDTQAPDDSRAMSLDPSYPVARAYMASSYVFHGISSSDHPEPSLLDMSLAIPVTL
ncbi:hypothetical protein PENSPDRAFT_364439 [Peniophora sp. CONT]|nr:hypothetical protein PENSPDRAFT_364439 [Peniophora sp. CONT]